MNPLVSVIMPVYNGIRFLPSWSVPSVLGQTYAQWELFIIDDGSTDDSPAVALQFAGRDPRIRLVRHDVNRGLAAAMNTGVRYSNGQYIAFLEQDDAWLPAKLAEQISVLAKQDSVSFACRSQAWQLSLLKKSIEGIRVAGFSGYVFRREVFDRIGGFDESPDLRGVEDGDLAARLEIAQARGRLVHGGEIINLRPLVIYCKHPASLSYRRNFTVMENRYRALCVRYDRPEFRHVPGVRQLLAFWYLHAGVNALSRGQRGSAWRAIVRALQCRFSVISIACLLLCVLPLSILNGAHSVYSLVSRIWSVVDRRFYHRRFPGLYAAALELSQAAWGGRHGV